MKPYLDLLKKILAVGEDVQSGATIVSENRKPTCRFLLGEQLRFDLRGGFPAVTTKKLLFDWVVDEVLWFLRGETNINTLGRAIDRPVEEVGGQRRSGNVSGFLRRPLWDQWAQPDGDVPNIYGCQWRRWEYCDYEYPEANSDGNRQGTIHHWDQVAKIVADLRAVKADPSDRARRRIILTAWNPPEIQFMGLAPCHTLAQFLPTNGYLDCVGHWRSIDMFTGCPFNIAQYAILTALFAGAAGLIPRHLVCNIADCHLYDNQFEQVAAQVKLEPYPRPYMTIDPRFWETAPDLTIAQLAKVDPAWFKLEDYRYHRRQPGSVLPEIAV
jgi:thymidylate synthase